MVQGLESLSTSITITVDGERLGSESDSSLSCVHTCISHVLSHCLRPQPRPRPPLPSFHQSTLSSTRHFGMPSPPPFAPNNPYPPTLHSGLGLNIHNNPISLPTVNLLACLFDLLQHRVVADAVVCGGDVGGLCV